MGTFAFAFQANLLLAAEFCFSFKEILYFPIALSFDRNVIRESSFPALFLANQPQFLGNKIFEKVSLLKSGTQPSVLLATPFPPNKVSCCLN